MGCAQSKIENEETVNRCKERKLHMERAVTARNKFAAAHSGYAMSLKNTGAALSDFAQGEVVYPTSPTFPATPVATGPPPPPPPIPPDNFLPPPPPLPKLGESTPLMRSVTMPEFSIPRPDNKHSDPIIEDENEEEIEAESSHSLKRRSSKSRSSRGVVSPPEIIEPEPLLQQRKIDPRDLAPQHLAPPPESKDGIWDYFFSTDDIPVPTLAHDESRIEQEEMERKMQEERARAREMEERARAREMEERARAREMEERARVAREMEERARVAREMEEMARVGEMNMENEKVESMGEEFDDTVGELPPQPPLADPAKVVKRVRHAVPPEGKKKAGGSNVSLVQIFVQLDDCFLRASEGAHDVSGMLEATRMHYHSNFADKKGHINHSERVMRVITWNRSFRGLSKPDDGVDDFDSEEHETHATVLDKMLAWEKKLYDEVKTGEQMKLEYQKKVASLNKLKKRGTNTEALERMKASVSHLHTRYIVDMQSMDSTVSEINRLRDDQLYPKLVVLVDGMATMWATMRKYHVDQAKIIQDLRSLDISQAPKETSDHHHERTRQLGGVVQEWHTNFTDLMGQQKEYIKALNSWLKLNLVPIDTNWKEKVSSPGRPQNPPIQNLLQYWNDHLEKLPDEPAKGAISNFAAIIKTIWQYQHEEIDFRNKCVDSRKDVNRKMREFDNWYNKYMQKRTPPDDVDPDRAHEKDLIAEKQLVVEAAKQKLEEDEEAYRRQCVQVREKSLMSLKTNLPDLFRTLCDFSHACSDMYNHLRTISHPKSE